MGTPLMLKSFWLNQLFWKIGPCFEFYMTWNVSQKRYHVTETHTRLLPWYLLGLLPLTIYVALLIFLLTIGLNHPATDSIINWLVTVLLLMDSGYAFIMNLYFLNLKNSHAFFDYYNAILQFTQRLSPHENTTNMQSQIRKFNLDLNDKLGIGLNILVLYMAMCPFLVALCMGYLSLRFHLRFEPVYLTLLNFLPVNQVNAFYSSPIFILSYCSTFVLFTMYEIFRVFSATIVGLLVNFYCIKQALFSINKMATQNRTLAAITEYKRLMVLQEAGKKTMAFVVFMLMGIGYCLIGLSASVTVMGFNNLPLQIYWVFPAITAIGTLVLTVALPNITQLYGLSGNMLRGWKLNTAGRGSLYVKKSFKALRPICFNFASIRKLNDESKVIYIDSIIERVMDGILCLQTA
ncbi:unnamed protein product [Orchesella dallaii]|uniref:Odorant receptor n=1 Tax=Orchesella dallaii TaxID=48710 RepID=A0ABP1RAH0_9HEXA